jgi:hypothetical protein
MTKPKTWEDLADWPPRTQPVTLMEMAAEARAVDLGRQRLVLPERL